MNLVGGPHSKSISNGVLLLENGQHWCWWGGLR